MLRFLFLALALACAPCASAQSLQLAQAPNEAALVRSLPALAAQALAVFHDDDRDKLLATQFRLQLASGNYAQAVSSIRTLRALRGPSASTLYLQYEIHAEAMAHQRDGVTFAQAYAEAFRAAFAQLDDKTALVAQFAFAANVAAMEEDLHKALDAQRGKREIALTDALDLLRAYQVREAYAASLPLVPALKAEDDARRYVIMSDVLVRTADGASIAALVVRPKNAAALKLPTLLEFTVYANDDWSLTDARRAAAEGYVGVVAYTRGKGRSPDATVPYERDGDDARAVIDWIAQQAWSDGRVGMYGGSYNSFAQWAAAKRLPTALKALMTSASAAPGIDVPMEGNVFLNFIYPWPFYVANNAQLDEATYGDRARWDALNENWYRSGKAYREQDRIDGTPNPIFRRWLDHPGYDSYWQSMIPYRRDFAAIDIPVLSTSGYFDGALVGAQYYFNEHHRYNRHADHTLVIGPYEHFTMQSGVGRMVQGYAVDAVANIDLQDLRFRWFDHVFKGAPRPELLKGKVNYQVMGANVWKHADSLATMGNARLRFYLQAGADNLHGLSRDKPAKTGSITQRVDFTQREDAQWKAPELSLTPDLDAHGGLVFASAAFAEPTEVSGLFAGHFDFVTNKRDMDVSITLYEHLPGDGGYLLLASHLGRASYAKDRTRRHLLKPGKAQHLDMLSERATSRLLQPGSALVVVVGINKQPGLQINYGSGKDVSDETIADAGEPMQVQWRNSSYIDVPVWR